MWTEKSDIGNLKYLDLVDSVVEDRTVQTGSANKHLQTGRKKCFPFSSGLEICG
jgi:hypothetical protein